MRIVEINSVNFGSTGGIMHQTADLARRCGDTVFTLCPDSRTNRARQVEGDILWGNIILRNICIKLAQLTGWHELFFLYNTWLLLRKLKKLRPDLIHLHNIHGDYMNYPLFFRFVKRHHIKMVWTLHDCWAFTGHCPHFDMLKCFKWKTECFECPRHIEYPYCRVDDSKRMYRLKKKWFCAIKDMTIVAPSKWMAGLIPLSFLKEYRVEQINNGIDINVFQPIKSNFRERYHCGNKIILLGVSFGWGKRKGLDVFIELSKRLDKSYQIVLVGTDDKTDTEIPEKIISIHRTSDQTELAEIYTAADLFVNPTREELFGLVNAEALACGTPVITFRSGGSPEVIDESCGVVVEKDDIDTMEREIVRICEDKPYTAEDCRSRAKNFDKNITFQKYVELYHNVFCMS